MTIDKLFFYSWFGAGDLFESREFAKEILNIIKPAECYYAHGKYPRIFQDIPEFKYTPLTEKMDLRKSFIKDDNNLYINTWIGRDSKYVLPKIGCVIDKNYEMFNDILRELGLSTLSKPFIEYIPIIDSQLLEVDNTNRFLDKRMNKKRILICNGLVQSLQAENFDFTQIIYTLANKYKELDFIVTQELPYKIDNIFSSRDITNTSDGYDLNEISHLAKFCDVIIGRKSGPFVFAHNRYVWYDNTKKSLSFTYAEHSSHFVQGNSLPLRKFWSSKTDFNGVMDEIERVLQ